MKKLILIITLGLLLIGNANAETAIKKYFIKELDVFGIKILGLKNTPDTKMQNAKSILEQWLDNDNDKKPDNILVVNQLVENNCSMTMGKSIRKIDNILDKKLIKEGVSETQVNRMFALASNEPEIAYLEEILHMITSCGYAKVYPKVFGEEKGTKIALAMDKARGGFFDKVPKSYPKDAWYTYDDKYCDYSCMITEYFYWSLTSYLEIQKNRFDEISEEWKFNTKEKMKKDLLMIDLLNNEKFKIPKIAPRFDIN